MECVEKILAYFQGDGLLVRTVSLNNLGDNFKDLDDNINDALIKHSELGKYYGPKRRWSIAHPQIKPYFFGMDKESISKRDYGILVIPSKVGWEKYHIISTKDESSNAQFSFGDTLLAPNDAMIKYHDALGVLKKGGSNHNSEVCTCGFDISAFCGILYKDLGREFNQDELKRQLSYVHETFKISEIPIFTYEENPKERTQLQHIGYISYP